MKLLDMANPVNVAKGAAGLAGTAVGVAETLTRETAHLARSGLHRLAGPGDQPARPERSALADESYPAATTDATTAVVKETPAESSTGGGSETAVADRRPPRKPSIVLPEPHAPEEPPVDVVGQALAAEAALGDRESPEGAGVAHEHRVASHDEAHGDAPLQRVEVEEIDDEVTAAFEDPQQD